MFHDYYCLMIRLPHDLQLSRFLVVFHCKSRMQTVDDALNVSARHRQTDGAPSPHYSILFDSFRTRNLFTQIKSSQSMFIFGGQQKGFLGFFFTRIHHFLFNPFLRRLAVGENEIIQIRRLAVSCSLTMPEKKAKRRTEYCVTVKTVRSDPSCCITIEIGFNDSS